MKVISTATNIGAAFKNIGRLREILVAFAVHGFADLLQRADLTRFLPGRYSENPRYKELPTEVRLRLCFEQLGPTFVKLGQLLATRPDIIPDNFIEEFAKLQDNVQTTPFSEIRPFIEAELGKPIHEVFAEFEERPMAAASIAQVYGAVLKTGERVAVKVQRPGIESLIKSDVAILRGLALTLERYIPETRPFNLRGVVEEFFRTILWELDFLVEANNIRRIKKNLSDMDQIAVPEAYPQSTGRILILERFEGVRFSDRDAVVASGADPGRIVILGADAFFHMVMKDGLFHGDLHPGNLFVLRDGRIGIIDFGIVGRLSRRVRDSIIVMFTALIDEDYEMLASEYVSLCTETGTVDLSRLQKDLMDAISPYMGMSLGDVNVGKLLLSSTSIAVRHHLIVPRELLLLFKALVTIEAMGKKLDPGFDMMNVGMRLAKEALATRYSKERLTRDALVMARDLQGTLETMPRMLKLFFKTWNANGFAIETKSEDQRDLARSVRLFTYYLLVCTLSFCLFALGITAMVLDKGPMVLGVPLFPVLTLGAGFFILGESLFMLRRRIK